MSYSCLDFVDSNNNLDQILIKYTMKYKEICYIYHILSTQINLCTNHLISDNIMIYHHNIAKTNYPIIRYTRCGNLILRMSAACH